MKTTRKVGSKHFNASGSSFSAVAFADTSPGAGAKVLESFLPPPEDIVFIDASALPAPSTSEKKVRSRRSCAYFECAVEPPYRIPVSVQEAADSRQTTVTAFARVIPHAERVSSASDGYLLLLRAP